MGGASAISMPWIAVPFGWFMEVDAFPSNWAASSSSAIFFISASKIRRLE